MPPARVRVGALEMKPHLVAANKIDALDDPDRLERLRRWLKERSIPLYPISAVTGEGLDSLREAMWGAVAHAGTTPAPKPTQVPSE